MALLCIPVTELVSFAFSTIPIYMSLSHLLALYSVMSLGISACQDVSCDIVLSVMCTSSPGLL